MNILFFLSDDIHCRNAWNLLYPELSSHNIKIILLKSKKREVPKEIEELAAIEKSGFQEILDNFSDKISIYENVNDQSAINDFKAFKPDLIASIRFKQIFQQPLIDIPRLGVFNLHSGILPKYRGMMPTFWTILNKEKEFGMTLHYITDKGIDSGPVIEIFKKELDYSATFLKNVSSLYHQGSMMMLKNIKKALANEKITAIDQKQLGENSYFSYPTKEDVARFLKIMNVV
jgi:methionyl-tRNA formyltransferase